MKRISLLVASLVVSAGLALGVVGVAQADWSGNLRTSEEKITIEKDQTHVGSLYAAGEKVVIDGTVDGDLYCATSEVVVNGTVNGDVLCAAQTITVNGEVGQDMRIAAQFLVVNGTVGGNLSAFAQDVKVASDGEVAGELNGASQLTTIDGTVSGDIVAAGQALRLNGKVGGNVDVAYESIDMAGSTSIAGNLNYTASQQRDIDADRVDGQVTYNAPTTESADSADWVSAAVMIMLAMLLTSLVLALIMPRFIHRASQLLREGGLMTVLLGFAVAFGGPLLVGVLMFTVFLAPLAIILLLAWLLVAMLSGVFFAYYIGSALLRSVNNIVLRMLGGAIVLLILYMIPFVNVFAIFAAWVVGSGMIVMTLTNGYRRPDYSLAATAAPVASTATKKRSTTKKK